MSELQLARAVLAEIDEAMATMDGHLLDGTPQDHTAYKAMVAERRGLRRAREMITERFSQDEREAFKLGGDL